MMRNHDVHIATHIMFMVTATMMWWPVMSPSAGGPATVARARNALSLSGRDSDAAHRRADHAGRQGSLSLVCRRPRGHGGSRRSTISSSAGCSCGCRGISGSFWRSASSSSSGRTKANRTHSNRGNSMGTPSAPVTPQPDDPALASVLEPLRSLLIPGEQLEAYAVQRRIFALVHRRVAVGSTTGRLISTIRGLFGGFTADDVRWQDLNDADIRVGILGATLSVTAFVTRDLASTEGAQRTLVFTGLRKEPGAGGLPAVSGPGAVVAGETAGAGPRRAASEIRRDPARSGGRIMAAERLGPLALGASRAGEGHAAEGTDYRLGVRADQGEDRRRALSPSFASGDAPTSPRHAHPARNASPPNGVMAPNQRTPDSANA